MRYLLDTDTCIYLINRRPGHERILRRIAGKSYGPLRADLQSSGTPIGPLDMLIAAHALSLKATLVSNNIREFSRVTGLMLENWSQ